MADEDEVRRRARVSAEGMEKASAADEVGVWMGDGSESDNELTTESEMDDEGDEKPEERVDVADGERDGVATSLKSISESALL